MPPSHSFPLALVERSTSFWGHGQQRVRPKESGICLQQSRPGEIPAALNTRALGFFYSSDSWILAHLTKHVSYLETPVGHIAMYIMNNSSTRLTELSLWLRNGKLHYGERVCVVPCNRYRLLSNDLQVSVVPGHNGSHLLI